MKIDNECYGVIINTSEKSWVRTMILRYKLKRLGFVKNNPKFMKRYGLEGRDNCEAWSRSLKKHKGKYMSKTKQGGSDAKGA